MGVVLFFGWGILVLPLSIRVIFLSWHGSFVVKSKNV